MYRSSSSPCAYHEHEHDELMGMGMASSFLHPSPSPFLNPLSDSYNNATGFLHRSSSSHSLPLFHTPHLPLNVGNPPAPPLPSSSNDFLDFNSMPVRRVFSTGDLQGMNGSQVLADNSAQEGGSALPSKVTRYSAEERKERIDKYRSKRNQRNFQKKITYACRKTLADSRPRVKGRFARNGEAETEAENEAEIVGGGNNNYGCFNQGNYNSCDANGMNLSGSQGELWRHIDQSMAADDEGIAYFYDEEMWTGLSDVVPMHMLS